MIRLTLKYGESIASRVHFYILKLELSQANAPNYTPSLTYSQDV